MYFIALVMQYIITPLLRPFKEIQTDFTPFRCVLAADKLWQVLSLADGGLEAANFIVDVWSPPLSLNCLCVIPYYPAARP